MGCAFDQQIIHPTQMPRLYTKPSRKAVIITSRGYNQQAQLTSRQNGSFTTQNIHEMRQPINGQALVLVEIAITKHFLFYGLNQNQKHDLIKLMKRYSALKNQYIFRKGDPATTFFIIISGKVQIETGLQKPVYLQKGQSFGQLALIYQAPRSISVVAKEETVLWGIDALIFNQFMERLKHKNFGMIRKFLDKLTFFTFLSQKQKENIVFSSNRFKYEAGSKIFRIKDPANSIFIVIQGRIQMQIPDKPKVLFEKGQMFGEGCLLGDQYRSGTAWCIQQTECLSISKKSLLKQLGIQANNILQYCICKWALKRSLIFNLLKRTIVDKIIFSGQMKQIEDGTIIQQKGKPTQRLYICLEGKINNCGVGSIFNQSPEQSGSKDLIKNQKGFIFTIKFQVLTMIINRPLKTFVETKQKRVKIKTQHMQNIDDFIIISKISQNHISQKFIVSTHTKPKVKYQIQCLKKINIAETQQEQNISSSIKHTKQIKQHPLIPKIVKVFNDNFYLSIVRQYVGALSFCDLIEFRKQSGLQLDQEWKKKVRFYSACIVDIIDHLHTQNVIHRNINPDAFLIGQNGYIYVNQLNHQKKISKQTKKQDKAYNNKKSKTIVGIPHYMAPEIISGNSYSQKSDLWSLGVLIYEVLFGFVPFGLNCSDVMEIYACILNQKLDFPLELIENYELQKQLLTNLMKFQQNQRLNLEQVKSNKYFFQINFQKLKNLQIKAPLPPLLDLKKTKKFPNIVNNINQYFYFERRILKETKLKIYFDTL